MNHRPFSLVLAVAVFASGCGLTLDTFEADSVDGSRPDSGLDVGDAASADATAPPRVDAGSPDAERPDAFVTPVDAGCEGVDLDGDGASTCTDCDDGDDTVYPGAPVICGDLLDNRCTGRAGDEELCGGLGTFVSEDGGNDSNPGTQARPVQTLAAGLAHAALIGAGVDVHVADGVYDEGLQMRDGVAVFCGYDNESWERDPLAHPTTIRTGHAEGVEFPTGTGPETILDGCVVEGLGEVSRSSAVTFRAGSSGVVRNSTIRGGDNERGQSVGVHVYPGGAPDGAAENPGAPRIEASRIELGRARDFGSNPNSAYGVWSFRTAVVISDTVVTLLDGGAVQRGIALFHSAPGAQVERSRVRPAGGDRIRTATGIWVVGGGVSLDANDIYTGPCDRWCMGVELGGLSSELISLRNNQIFAGDSVSGMAAGVVFEIEGTSSLTAGDVLVHSNLIVGPGSGTVAAAMAWLNFGTQPIVAGRVLSNIILARGSGSALYENSRFYDPQRVEGNAIGHIDPTMTTALLYMDEGAYPLQDIAAVNARTDLPTEGVANLWGNCGLVGPWPGGDPHLPAGSPCIDMGTRDQAPTIDFEGDPRPAGREADPGVDETSG